MVRSTKSDRRVGIMLVIAICISMCVAASQSGRADGLEQPSARAQVYWGAYIDGAPWDMSRVATFQAQTGLGASIIHWGEPWWHDGVYQPFFPADLQTVRDYGAIPMLDWGSWDWANGISQPDFQLTDISDGHHDAFIRAWAAAARDWSHPFFLRFDWEMNCNCLFPWSEQLNGNHPGDYVRAWRHVHDIFTQVGATNATWVWCPNTDYPGNPSLASLYPGSSYVDWVCVDGYNWGFDRGDTWQSFAEVFSQTCDELGALAPDKPIMIGEVSSSENGGSKADWITDALQIQLPQYFPHIKALVWFDWNNGDPNLSWAADSSPPALAALREALRSGYFAGNDFADLTNSPVPDLFVVHLVFLIRELVHMLVIF
jgi:hypothetical protein